MIRLFLQIFRIDLHAILSPYFVFGRNHFASLFNLFRIPVYYLVWNPLISTGVQCEGPL